MSNFAGRVWNGIKSGAWEVANSYGVGGLVKAVGGAAGGAVAGAKTVQYIGTTAAIRGGTKAIIKGAVASSGVGTLAVVAVDGYTFARGFKKGWDSYQ